jgi:hypothetical protein
MSSGSRSTRTARVVVVVVGGFAVARSHGSRLWVIVLLAACGTVESAPDAVVPRDPAVRLVSFQEIEVIPQATSIQGRSGGRSALLWGKSVWTFGTTVLNAADAAGTNWHASSMSTSDDLIGSDGIVGFVEQTDTAGAPVIFLPPTAAEASYNELHKDEGARYEAQPTGTVFDEPRQRALVFYDLFYTRPGTYQRVGQSIALWSAIDGAPQRPEIAPTDEHPTNLFRAGEPGFGGGAQIVGDELYSLACEFAGDGYRHPCQLAKVPLDEAMTRASWRVWDGTDFSANLEDAATIFEASRAISVSWNSHIERWIAVYAEPLSSWIVARTAAELTGPWSDPARLFQAPPRDAWWVTDAVHHDAYTENDGQTLYVSYSRPNPDRGVFASDVVWVRVDIARAAEPDR